MSTVCGMGKGAMGSVMITRQTAAKLWIALSGAVDAGLSDDPRSPKVKERCRRFAGELMSSLASSPNGRVELTMHMSLFVHNGRTMADASIRGRTTIGFLRTMRAGGLRFSSAMTPESIHALVDLACRVARNGGFESLGIPRQTALKNLVGIDFLAPSDDVRWDCVSDIWTTSAYSAAGIDLLSAEPTKLEVVSAVEDAMNLAEIGGALDLAVARTASEGIYSLDVDGFDNLLQLAERPEFDVFTVQHSLRVSLLASYVASFMGMPEEAVVELTAGAMFHDVGKGRIPEAVLYKPGRLDDDERRIMHAHPELGAEILLESESVSPYALGAAWGHHLRHDGRGYPERRAWFQASRATSLIQICDVFEALTSRRPYKAPYSPARAYQILYSDPGAFDPGLLAVFTRAMGMYPPGRFIELMDGRLGRVAKVGRQLDRPSIRLFPDGELLVLDAPECSNLAVKRLLEEPELIRLLRNEPLETQEADAQTAGEARDDEFQGLGAGDGDPMAEGFHPPGELHAHGADCRLC